jgi:hypothetical protein
MVRFNQDTWVNRYRVLSRESYPTNGVTWMHLAAVFDGRDIRIYLDGVLDTVVATPGLVIGANAEPLSIGSQPDGLRPYTGSVDEVRVFRRALTPAEVRYVMSSLAPGAD